MTDKQFVGWAAFLTALVVLVVLLLVSACEPEPEPLTEEQQEAMRRQLEQLPDGITYREFSGRPDDIPRGRPMDTNEPPGSVP